MDFGWKEAIAGVSLVVSLLTAYFSLFRPARLRVRFGKILLLQCVGDGSLHVKPELALLNEGATVAIVHEIAGELRRLSDDNRERLQWIETLTTEFNPETRGTDTRFKSFPEIMFVAKSQAVATRLLLTTEHPYALAIGDYELEMVLQSDGTSVRRTTIKSRVRIRGDDIEWFDSNKPAPEAKTGRNLRFQFEQGPNTNCYLRRLAKK